jgi:hypothetical protein
MILEELENKNVIDEEEILKSLLESKDIEVEYLIQYSENGV